MFSQLTGLGSRIAQNIAAGVRGDDGDARPPRSFTHGYATIAVSGHQSVQGPITRHHWDGRVTIDTGRGEVSGYPMSLRAHQTQPESAILVPLFAGQY